MPPPVGPVLEITSENSIVFDTLIQGNSGFERVITFFNSGDEKLIIAGIQQSKEFCKAEWDSKAYGPNVNGAFTIKCMVEGRQALDEVFVVRSNSVNGDDTLRLKGFVVGPPRIKLDIVK